VCHSKLQPGCPRGVPTMTDVMADGLCKRHSDIRRFMKTEELYTKDEAVRLPIQAVFIGVYANSSGALGCSLGVCF